MVGSLVCPRCSTVATPDQVYCGKCGAPLSSGAVSEAVQAEAAAPKSAPKAARGRARAAGSGAGGAKAKASPAPAPEVAPAAPPAAPPAVAPAAEADDAPSEQADIDPRLAALRLVPPAPPVSRPTPSPTAPSATPQPALAPRPLSAPLRNPFAPPAASQFAPPVAAQFAPPAAAQFVPPAAVAPDEDPAKRVPGGYVPPAVDMDASTWTLRPSRASSETRPAGSSLSLSVGAVPVSSVGKGSTSESAASPTPPTDRAAAWPPAPPPAPPFAAPAAPSAAPGPIATAGPAVARQQGAFVRASESPARKESTQEMVPFYMVAAGAALGVASLFLPWAAENGIGVGTTGATPPANQWGLTMPAALPLILLSALVLGAVSGSDRAQERLPHLSASIAQVTDMILPMILGGLYLGVFLLYATLPWGFGIGIFVVLVGAVLLITGAIVTLVLPPKTARDT